MGKFDDMNLSNFGNTVILITGKLFVKTEEAMQQLIHELEAIGYDVKESEHGTNYWFASLNHIRKGKCNSCGELISVQGIKSHGHRCEKCGEVTFWKIIDGTTIRFSFIEREEDERSSMRLDMKMIAKCWDTDAGYVYFHPQIEGGLWTNEERAQVYFDSNSDKWEEVEEGGEKLIKMRYTQPWDYEVCAFNPSDISSPYGKKIHNHSIVNVWKGTVYDEWSKDFPLPDSISLYGMWHMESMSPTPTIHEEIMRAAGQVCSKDYYYQDGRQEFFDSNWRDMSMFIRHFTKLDADKFDEAWPHFRKDGPGGIDDLATWCHPDAVARNEPNICNMLLGLSKVRDGQPLTNGEVDAMKHAAEDRGIMEYVRRVFSGRL